MAVFAISDLHLSLGLNKPMDVFGVSWENYVQRIEENWRDAVSDGDTVLMCGDISWATYLEQAIEDFKFIHSLPGKKIISKGNHDYWWCTAAKLQEFKEKYGFDDIVFLHNNAVLVEGVAVCCARGWKSPFEKNFTCEDQKIYERELIRLRLSLEDGKKKSGRLLAMLHYPPDFAIDMLLDEYNIEKCIYGHLHGRQAYERRSEKIRNILVSSDFLEFHPLRLEL